MPIDNPIVGEIYNTKSERATQWMYVYKTEGPYVWVSGLGSNHVHTQMRKRKLKSVANSHNQGSNGLRMISGDILGLAGPDVALGVLYLQGNSDE